jgi:hypothetical protein
VSRIIVLVFLPWPMLRAILKGRRWYFQHGCSHLVVDVRMSNIYNSENSTMSQMKRMWLALSAAGLLCSLRN